jgi:hypothetical protein
MFYWGLCPWARAGLPSGAAVLARGQIQRLRTRHTIGPSARPPVPPVALHVLLARVAMYQRAVK